MSVEPTTDDSTDFEQSEESAFDVAFRDVLDELPERFHEHSKKYNGSGEKLILIPNHGHVDQDGDTCGILLLTTERRTIERHGFSPTMVSMGEKGAGVKFWFRHEE